MAGRIIVLLRCVYVGLVSAMQLPVLLKQPEDVAVLNQSAK